MKALRVTSHESAPIFLDMSIPTAGPGQVLLKIAACGLNFADLLLIRGQYQETPPLPFTLGMEVSGCIEAIGEGVTGLAIGDRVAVFGGQGGLAEYGIFDADRCVVVPHEMSDTAAACTLVAYGTSHLALTQRAKLQAGETLLVLGAAGGVGLTAVEIGKAMGARVIACARGADKLAIAKDAGADIVIDSETEDLKSVVKSHGGADVVYDPVGGALFKAALGACKPEARYQIIGFASGDIPQIPANILLVKNITVQGFYWGGVFQYQRADFMASLDAVVNMVAKGELTPHISHTLPLDRAMDGFELLRTRKSTGRVVITVP